MTKPFDIDELSCVACGESDAPYTIRIAGTKATMQLCEECHDALTENKSIKSVDEEDVLFDVVYVKPEPEVSDIAS